MPVDVILPMLGETMDEATIVQWLYQVGEPVKKGEPLFQVETDKAILDVNAPADGTLIEVRYEKGSKVPALAIVGSVALPGEPITSRSADASCTSKSGQSPAIAAQTVARHSVSPRARKLAADTGIDTTAIAGTGPGGRIVARDVQKAVEQMAAPPTRVAATPLARKAAAEAGIELERVTGTGPGGRIMLSDLPAPRPAAGDTQVDHARPEPSTKSTPLAGVRRIIAERMATSSSSTAAVTLITEADATELARLRALLNEQYATQEISISYTDLLVWIVARALRDLPYMNAKLVGDAIQQLESANIGVAVDTERGLLVPVIRDAGSKSVLELSKVTRELVQRARAGKSGPDELSGGTFTITNLGMYDIDAFTPIINLPECAILGVGRLIPKPVVRDGLICVRTMMTLSLTFDHRLTDGAPAARFLQRIKSLVEQPSLMQF